MERSDHDGQWALRADRLGSLQVGLTDAGLKRLLELNPDLTRIELRGNPVTDAGLAAMRAAYPGCELVTDSGHPFARFR